MCPFFVPLPPSSLPPPDLVLRQVLSLPSSTGLPPHLLSPPPCQSQPKFLPDSPLLAPSPYTEQPDSFTERREPESRPTLPVRAVRTGLRVPRPHPPIVPDTHVMALRPSSVPLRVPLPPPPESSLHAIPDPGSDLSTAASALVAKLVDFAAGCRLDYAISLVVKSESDCPPSVGGECALGTDVLEDRVKRPPGSPRAFKARYVARGFSQRQGVDFFQTFSRTPKMTTLRVLLHVAQCDNELHSLDFSTTFLQCNLHEEIWLRRPRGFTKLFPAGTQWSLRRPVYGLPREWHDTLRTTLAALGFAPSTADPSLFLRTDTSLPPFYILVYIDELVFATAHTEALALVLERFGFCYSSPQFTPLPTGHSLSDPPLDESYIGHGARAWRMGSSCPHWTRRHILVLYVDRTSHRLEHRTKHIALRYFLARELQQRGQLRLAYVATRANTADIFTKALQSGDH
ncbi:unnamed protein product [Closterium sp. NIES-53]